MWRAAIASALGSDGAPGSRSTSPTTSASTATWRSRSSQAAPRGARPASAHEARVTGRLGDHPNVITVYDSGETDGVPYLVLRAMTGGSLAEALAREPGARPGIGEAVRIAREIALALTHVHAHGIVHRDVKPDNVWLAADGSAALGDFGIALVLDRDSGGAEAGVIGTPRYLSPEQARGSPVGPACDLYALGVTLYELVTGRTPFDGDSTAEILAHHLATPPPPPSDHAASIPAELERLILDLLAKDPAARPASAQAVADLLAGIAAAADTAAGAGVIVGRERVLERIGAAWSAALAGRPQIVALTGEPGIGKTRCAEELARQVARAGGRVAWGLCSEPEAAAAYRPWLRALEQLAPGDASPLRSAAPDPSSSLGEARLRRFDAVAGQLRALAARHALLVVLEDLHWADRSSLELLAHVARELRDARLLILLTYRDDELAPSATLAEIARRPAFERIELRGLEPGEVARYAALVTGAAADPQLAGALHARTGGNPLFVGEVVRLLADEGGLEHGTVIPGRVRDVVTARLERLPLTTRAVLDAAAVAGVQFGATLVAGAAEVSRAELVDALEPAVAHRVVAVDAAPGSWWFSHAIVRDVIEAALPAARRARLHARIGELLERRRARGQAQPAAEIAHHCIAAARAGGDPQPALDASLAAAAEARAGLAHSEAAVHYGDALEAAELAELDAPRRCEIMLQLAEMRQNAADIETARHRYAEAAAIADAAGRPALFAEAVLGYARWQQYGAVDRRAIELLEAALGRLDDDDSALRARLLGRLAIRLHPRDSDARRAELMDAAIAMSRRLGDRAVLAQLLRDSAALHHGPGAAARRDADTAETIALAREAGDDEAMLWARAVRYVDAFGAGQIAAADAELAAYAQLAGSLRQPYYRWSATMMRAARATFDGRLDEGSELAAEAYELQRAHGLDSEEEYPVQRLVLALAADRPPPPADVERLRAVAERFLHLPLWRAIVTYLDWLDGDRDAAGRGLDLLARDGFAAALRDADALCVLALAAETCAGLGDAAHAAVLHELLAAHRDRNVVIERGWGALGAAAHGLGLLALTLGDRPLAADHLARALALHRRWRARPWEQRTLRAAAANAIALG